MSRPIFVFSTPPTPNGDLHLGHLSGPYLGADVFVRFQRMTGATAWHLTGSDDYQSYVVGRARRDGLSPAETAARFSAEIAETLALMDISIDQYTVTDAEPGYRDGLRAYFSRVVGSGKIAPREDATLFDGETGDYLYEVDVSGGCPGCGEPAGGNICEECGEPNFCADLIEPVSARSEVPPKPGTISRYSLPLHEFAATVAEHHSEHRVPARLKELAARLFRRERLHVAVSHPAPWGVPPAEEDVPGQVIWVWPEMSYGFLHGIEALGRRLGRDWKAAEPRQDWKIVHFFGYDNSFYHSILYPVLYRLAHPAWRADIDYHLNEFLLLDGEKFSTSRSHAIWGKDVLEPGTVDAVRFFLARIRPEAARTNFQRGVYERVLAEDLIGRWQHWLNGLGERIERHCGGTAPELGERTAEHRAFEARLRVRLTALTEAYSPDAFSLNHAAAELDGIVDDALRFARLQAPLLGVDHWTGQSGTALTLELAAARLLAHGAGPVMPRFAAKLAAALGLPAPDAWPDSVETLPAGTRVDLARETFFAAPDTPTLAWLSDQVRTLLQLHDGQALDGRTLSELGMESLQAVALQYQILDELGIDMAMEELVAVEHVAALAALLDDKSGGVRI